MLKGAVEMKIKPRLLFFRKGKDTLANELGELPPELMNAVNALLRLSLARDLVQITLPSDQNQFLPPILI